MEISLPLRQWLDITATSNMPLYAILSNVSEAKPVREYYQHDGSQTPTGLYSATPYANWTEAMPMIVPLDERSPFLKWVETTEHKDWGWLARSPMPFERILQHMRGLIKVILPDGKEVFFRYWDGKWFAEQLRFMGDDWREVMPPFAFYLVNGEDFTVHITGQGEPKTSPWWRVPQALIDAMMQKDNTPLVEGVMKTLRELRPDIFHACDNAVLASRIRRILGNTTCMPDMNKLIELVSDDIRRG
ncbi:DUF4123 domain-containing protein [Salmonella enterica]|uniref:DUF4123 domain-containing protein n=1 Tax=Salmonella enterica TaxID=28901 RepID=UPI0009AEE83F|nr:DUF4123 domain-containing protein [Salmonella enterica]EED3682384.1 DUF4123 domain-containing protein [Salmonella enterica subsp. enterica]EAM7548822.1 DUF4123 domain-containing protein [Salmonella enterica]EAU3387956.1 DUF4123 domain-containing protein [Salmonella enterica]EAU3438907.1 DUF4123 domain-containing protein [Salmonella enterica]EAW5079865.1 DUF4123 domain-containing protein [Salmonella enterica]